jgi:hypothetical protein
VAGGYKNYFGMMDFNRTTVGLDNSLTNEKAKVISSLVGHNGELGRFPGAL